MTNTHTLAERAGRWHLQPRARAALAACVAADERPVIQFETFVQTRDEYLIPAADLGRKVEAIRAAYGAAALAHGDETGDYTFMHQWCDAPNATRAIMDAFAAAAAEKGAVA